jgi:Domain of Unknown Function (DUF1080)/Circularly permutated YpsA SLOG family
MRHVSLCLIAAVAAGLLMGPPWGPLTPFRPNSAWPAASGVGTSDPVSRGDLTARHRANDGGNGVSPVAPGPPAGADPVVSDWWAAWEQVPTGQPRGKTHPETPDWAASPDGTTKTTPARPKGAPFASEEGPYYRTKRQWTAFRLTLQYRTMDRQPITPRPPPFPHTNQDWSDSGVYIFDRYEVQILDPSKFDSSADPAGGVLLGGEIRDDPRVRGGGRMVPNNRNQQVPGGLCGVDIPGGRYINRANRTGEWNNLEIEFRPPVLTPTDPKVIMKAARIRTVLNGHVVFDGKITAPGGQPLNGTGVMRHTPAPAAWGPIYLQSHWGSQVEFRAPQVEEIDPMPATVKPDAHDSDGTLWFGDRMSPGGRTTLDACRFQGKPFLLVFQRVTRPSQVVAWLEEKDIRVLSVAGNRGSKNPGVRRAGRAVRGQSAAPGYQSRV